VRSALADRVHKLQQSLDRNLDALSHTITPDSVHTSRTAARRLRAVLHAFKRQLDSAAAARYTEVLKELAHELDAVREADVTRQAVSAVSKGRFAHKNEQLVGLQALAEERRNKAVLNLKSAMNAAPWAARVEKLHYVASDPFLIVDSQISMTAATHRVLTRRRRRVRAALRYRGQAPRALHKLRLKIKTIRYLIEVCMPTGQGIIRSEVEQLRGLQDCLGDLHDAWFVRRQLKDQWSHLHGASQLSAKLKDRQSDLLRRFRKHRKSLLRIWRAADDST
jgi:CHAD domain-containing protein